MSIDMNSGYSGYRMSKRAEAAYFSGEKPYSRWTKEDILKEVRLRISSDNEIYKMLKSVRRDVLKKHLLYYSSWHHTSSYANETDFYSFNEDVLEKLDKEIIILWKNEEIPRVEEKEMYFGSIEYLEWTGTRNHPKSKVHILKDVYIKEKGCFYYVYDKDNNFILKKKIDGYGTYVTNYEYEEYLQEKEQQRQLAFKNNSSASALHFLESLDGKQERSNSNHIYAYGRKPTPYQYERLNEFLKKGENRIYVDEKRCRYVLETWTGEQWESE